MNKQFDLFQKMKMKEVCENINRMTYAYINPDTKQPTVVPSKHYKDILDQPVEVLVNDQVKKQFLNIMFKQLEQDRDTLTSKIAHGKKEIRICEDIEKRVPDIEEKLKMVNTLETERIENQKEYERSLNL